VCIFGRAPHSAARFFHRKIKDIRLACATICGSRVVSRRIGGEGVETMTKAYALALPALALLGLIALAGCGSDVSIQQTNSEQTAQLNAIADNMSETAGSPAAAEGTANATSQSMRAGARNRPRKY
jgi:hypothetical protein